MDLRSDRNAVRISPAPAKPLRSRLIKAPPCRLDLAASHLCFHASPLRTFGGPRRRARRSDDGGVIHDSLQPRQRVIAILIQAAKTLRLDNDHAFGRDALVAMR